MQFSAEAETSFQKGQSSGRSSISARSPVSVSRRQSSMRPHVQRVGSAAAEERALPGERCAVAKRVEAMQAQIVAASLHVRRLEGTVERVAQDRQVLEVDLLLEVLGAGRDQHTLAAQDRRYEIGECLAGACSGLREQDAALGEGVWRRRRPSRAAPGAPRSPGVQPRSGRRARARPRPPPAARRHPRDGRRLPLRIQGERPAQPLDFSPHARQRAIVVRSGERARDQAPRSCPFRPRPFRGWSRRASPRGCRWRPSAGSCRTESRSC